MNNQLLARTILSIRSWLPRARIRTRLAGGSHGQALVEMAISFIILILILSGVVDLGRAFFTYVALQNAAGEGAYYGSAFPFNVTSADEDDPNNIEYRTLNEVPEGLSQVIGWDPDETVVTVTAPNPGRNPGTPITVVVEAPFEFIGPLTALIGWSEITLRADATQTILNNGGN